MKQNGEIKEQQEQRMVWWREARFGMFIYSFISPENTFGSKFTFNFSVAKMLQKMRYIGNTQVL